MAKNIAVSKYVNNGTDSTSDSSSTEDPFRNLLKKIWKQHSSVVDGLRRDLHAASKLHTPKTTTCDRCEELSLKNTSLESQLEEKRKITENLDKEIIRLNKKIGDFENENTFEKPNFIKPSLSPIALVPETQDVGHIETCYLNTQNPCIPETLDPFHDPQNGTCVPETLDFVRPTTSKYETLNAIIPETCDADETICNDVRDTNLNDTPPFLSIRTNDNIEAKSNVICEDKSADNSPLLLGYRSKNSKSNQSQSGFMSSIRNSMNCSGLDDDVKVNKKRPLDECRYLVSKRKSRKQVLKQTTLDGSMLLLDKPEDDKDSPDDQVTILDDDDGGDNDDGSDKDKIEQRLLDLEDEEDPLESSLNDYKRLYKKDEPNYKYGEVVRKQEDRKKLDGHYCHGCEMYYKNLGLSDAEMKSRMKNCSRHRAKFSPQKSPEHFWEIDFPSTQECLDRGYMERTQKMKLKTRRKRAHK